MDYSEVLQIGSDVIDAEFGRVPELGVSEYDFGGR